MLPGALKELVFLLGPFNLAAIVVSLGAQTTLSKLLSMMWDNDYLFVYGMGYLIHYFLDPQYADVHTILRCSLSVSVYFVLDSCFSVCARFDNEFPYTYQAQVDAIPWKENLKLLLSYGGLIWAVFMSGHLGKHGREYGDANGPSFPVTRNLVVSGPYAYVRNPMALGYLACQFYLHVALNGSFRALVFLVLVVGIFTAWFIFVEEPDLQSRFGSRYEVYATNVPRWMPRLTPYVESSSVNPNEGGTRMVL